MKPHLILTLFTLVIVTLVGCASPRNYLEPESNPLKEQTLQGAGNDKVLLIPLKGFISDERQQNFLRSEPSMVQEIVSHLRKAEQDSHVRAVVLKIDSPGGTVTASDILYNEILSFKERTGARVVVTMMNVTASGGYYISLPADYIFAHPTTITGSVGVLFIQPKITGLMSKIGVDFDVSKSGDKKDMGSPLRQSTAEEQRIMQDLTETLGRRFLDLVVKHRKLSEEKLADVASGRVYLADEALRLGLIDRVGYLEDALKEAKNLAGLPKSAKVVVYRRASYPDDNLYNTVTVQQAGGGVPLVNIELPDSIQQLHTGFYYLWAPGLDQSR
jgi:protease-4